MSSHARFIDFFVAALNFYEAYRRKNKDKSFVSNENDLNFSLQLTFSLLKLIVSGSLESVFFCFSNSAAIGTNGFSASGFYELSTGLLKS